MATKAGGNTQTAKKSSAQKKSVVKAETNNTQISKKADTSSPKYFVISAVMCAISLFIVICYAFPQSCGFIGEWTKNVLFGLFAGGSMLVPVFLFVEALYLKRDVETGHIFYRPIFSAVVTVVLSAMLHAIFSKSSAVIGVLGMTDISEFFVHGKNLVGGGAIGGIFGSLLMMCVGITGTIILAVLFILFSSIYLLGFTPSTFVRRVKRLCADIEAKNAQKQEKKEAEAAEQREKRRQAEAASVAREEKRRAQSQSAAEEAERRRTEAEARANEKRLKEEEENREIERIRMESQARRENAQKIRRDSLAAEEAFRASAQQRRADVGCIFEDETFSDAEPQAYGDEDGDKEFRGESVAEFWRNNEVRNDDGVSGEADDDTYNDDDAYGEESTDADVYDGGDGIDDDETYGDGGDYGADGANEDDYDCDDVIPTSDTGEAELPEDTIPWEDIVGEEDSGVSAERENADPMAEELRRTLDGAKRKIQSRTHNSFDIGNDNKTEKGDDMDDMNEIIADVAEEADEEVIPEPPKYIFPPLDLLKRDPGKKANGADGELAENAEKLISTLRSFNVRAKIVDVSRGPTITRYEIGLEAGTRVRTIMNLVDDISYALATNGVRIEGVIPGKSAIGIEVPNQSSEMVYLRSLLEDKKFSEAKSCLTAALGKSVSGDNIFFDISKMPHLLIAGTTGSGKSVCINTLLISLLYKATPDEVKLVLVDPKKVELNVYNGIPHLLVPVVFDPKKAAGALHWCVTEMERRFDLIESMNVRNLDGYNKAIENDPAKEKLPRIVIVIDELADLMMTASNEVETSICRIAQKARAAGMHLIIGTQRPSVDVITGLIKANVPSRIAFTVMSQIDSRTIIDTTGAEKLIGKGDMLFAPIGSTKPMRAQGAFVSDAELESIIEFIKENAQKAEYSDEIIERIEKEAALCGKKGKAREEADDLGGDDEEEDPKLDSAIKLAVESGKISTSLIQRKLSLGYGRAAKLIDVMERRGIVSKPEGQKPREVLITKEQYLEMQMRSGGAASASSADDQSDDFPDEEI